MDLTKSTAPVSEQYPIPYLLAFLLVAFAVAIYVMIEKSVNISDIQANWSEYRCQPQMMPFAGFFGYSINENFEFCLQQIIQENTKGVTGPFAQGMLGFTSVLTNLMESANSFRTMLATLVGGIIKIVSEFKARMTALMGRIKLTASRMKSLMYRVYGTMFAMVYMGISAQTGIVNFGDTFIFKFIDTFCFPPEQIITLESGQEVPIVSIKVNDILKGGHKVESVYKFLADGQEMVQLGDIQVSSNHFVKHNEKWLMAKDHPDAIQTISWSGGNDRLLICLSTHDHIIPIGSYFFSDYNETDEANSATQKWIDNSLNGRQTMDPPADVSYDVGNPFSTMVKTSGGYKPLYEIKLGEKLNKHGIVVGIQVSELKEFCRLPNNQRIAKGTLVWDQVKSEWTRAYLLYPEAVSEPTETIALFVSPGAKYEIQGGYIIRDAMEIYSPDTKKLYAEILLQKNT